jgi:hypothetical protein
MKEKGYKEVYLDYRGHPFAITIEAYEQIHAIIQAHLICRFCRQGYSETNPMVAENVCLVCFLKYRESPPRDLTFEGEVISEYGKRYGYITHKFLDRKGYVYLMHTTRLINDSLNADICETLVHYGFRVPTTYTLKGGSVVDLVESAWSRIYGDFQKSPVVIATYHESYDNHIDTLFLLYRDRDPVEFSRRKKQHRMWYEEAKAELEATYTPHIGYVVSSGQDGEDRTSYQLYDYHMYPGIISRAVAEYNQTHQKQASTLL